MKIEIPVIDPTRFITEVEKEVWESTSMPFLETQYYWTKWDNSVSNRAWVAKMLPVSQHVGTWECQNVFHCRQNDKASYYFVVQEGKAIYAVRYSVTELKGLKATCQTSVWRDKDSPTAVSVAAWVFFHKLLPRFGNIVSDAVQSQEGKAFWIRRSAEALRLGLYVYAIKTDAKKILVVQQVNLSDTKWAAKIWSTTDQDFQNRRLLISKTKLSIAIGKS